MPNVGLKKPVVSESCIMKTDNLDLLREQIVTTARAMNAHGINQGTAGNISVRVKDGLMITPSSLPYDRMKPEDIVFMRFDGSVDQGKPSSEWRFHRDILVDRPDVDVVLHCHSPHATSLACLFIEIPAFHYMISAGGGTTIRCAPYATFGTQELSDYAIEALKDRLACLLGQHGQIALGKSLDGALARAIEVESLSQIYRQVLQIGKPIILSDEKMQETFDQIDLLGYGKHEEEE